MHIVKERFPVWEGRITKITCPQLSLPVAGMSSKK